MVIVERALKLWARSVQELLQTGSYECMHRILADLHDNGEPIPDRYYVQALQSFFPQSPGDWNCKEALMAMGFLQCEVTEK